jgi:hypothetical protein
MALRIKQTEPAAPADPQKAGAADFGRFGGGYLRRQ